MGLTKYNFGQLLELTTEVNSKLQYCADDVKGMTITKEIIPTKADVKNTELHKFLIVRPQDFIFNPRTHGKKIGFGYNNTNETFIISWNNIAFHISEQAKDIVLPEYLFLHFNRSEWDREACFRSWGSSTEVFSWDALCEMEVLLPPIEIQRKYVYIYKAMVDNQAAYETRLEDLKLVCDGYIEKLKRTAPMMKIEPYIEQSDIRNENQYGLESVKGISIQKTFIETKADMEGVSLKPYLVVKPDYFAYVPVTSRNGEKITLAQNMTDETFIVSSSYIVFFVKNTSVLNSNYLYMYFDRPEFDRYSRFCSWGSARETFDWSEMCEVEIPIPDISIQRSIADIYIAYKSRKTINERLKSQIKDICPILIKGAVQEAQRA